MTGSTPERPPHAARWRLRLHRPSLLSRCRDWIRRSDALPGAGQRRRLLSAVLLAVPVWLLRPWPPFQWLPGWCVGALLLWALAELVGWLWWPQRSA